jgi:hypothetical protein
VGHYIRETGEEMGREWPAVGYFLFAVSQKSTHDNFYIFVKIGSNSFN